MKIHKKEVLLSISSLIIGLIIYIFFRNGTYIHTFLKIHNSFNLSHLNFFGSDFIKYYFPDFLWAFALTNALLALSNKKNKEKMIIGAVVILLSILWEVLQIFEIVSGTFDFIDCFIYLFAVIIAVAIATERKRK